MHQHIRAGGGRTTEEQVVAPDGAGNEGWVKWAGGWEDERKRQGQARGE